MSYSIIIKNNYLWVNDSVTGKQYEALAKDVLIRKDQPESESYAFSGVNGMPTTLIPLSELKDGNGDDWADAATFESWYTTNMGKSSGGGSVAPADLISEDADNALELGDDEKLFVPKGSGSMSGTENQIAVSDDKISLPKRVQIKASGATGDVKFDFNAENGSFVMGDQNGDFNNYFYSLSQAGGHQFAGPVTMQSFSIGLLTPPPSSSTDAGNPGQVIITPDYIYVCTDTNTWKRTTLETF